LARLQAFLQAAAGRLLSVTDQEQPVLVAGSVSELSRSGNSLSRLPAALRGVLTGGPVEEEPPPRRAGGTGPEGTGMATWQQYRGEPVAWTRTHRVTCTLNGREVGTTLVRSLYRADGSVIARVPLVGGLVP
jgi:hypothetical protein